MSILASVAESLAARVKGDPSYRIALGLSDRQLVTVLWHRARQYMRGLPLRLRARRVRGAVFRGRRVVVEHAYALSSGAGLILEDGVLVHALSSQGVSLGRNVTVARGATLTCTGVIAELGTGISIGDRSAVGAGSFLGGQGGVRVGSDVIMGPAVRIFSENHNFDDVGVPIRAQGQSRAPVRIEDDCWIGAGVTILAGVTIGRGCVIAAGAVVTRDVPPFSVAGGVPAGILRSRLQEEAPPLEPPIPPEEALVLRQQAEHILREGQ
jgi:acetyltransferase-like isoleucine patch superfamily enzyme